MAVPNLNTTLSRVEGKLAMVLLTTSSQTILTISGAAVRTIRLRSLFATNKLSTNQSVTINVVRSSVTYPILTAATVIRNSIFNVSSLEDAIYLEPGDSLTALAGANNAITLFCSYEDIT
jgi:hypothetical protein